MSTLTEALAVAFCVRFDLGFAHVERFPEPVGGFNMAEVADDFIACRLTVQVDFSGQLVGFFLARLRRRYRR